MQKKLFRFIRVRVTKKELDFIENMAKKNGMNRSDYIAHMCVMNNHSKSESATIFAFLERINYYLLQFKNNEIDKKNFLRNMETEVDHLWYALK